MTEADSVSFGKAERRQQSLHRALAGIVKTNQMSENGRQIWPMMLSGRAE